MRCLFIFFILILINSCSSKRLVDITVSTKENKFLLTKENKFLLTKEDSIVMKKVDLESKKFADSCEKYKLNCIFDRVSTIPEFVGGFGKFKDYFIQNFKLPKHTKYSNVKFILIIGKNNSIHSVEVLDCYDYRLKNEIYSIMNKPFINKWISAKTDFDTFPNYQIVFYLTIK